MRQKGVCIYFRPALLFRSLFVHKALQSHVVWLVIGRVSSSGVWRVRLYRFSARAGCLSCQSNAENSGMSPAVRADSHAALNTKQALRVTTATTKSISAHETVSLWIKIKLSLVLNTFNSSLSKWIVGMEAVRHGCNTIRTDVGYMWLWSKWWVQENNPQTLRLICSEERWETFDLSNPAALTRWLSRAEIMIWFMKNCGRKLGQRKFG